MGGINVIINQPKEKFHHVNSEPDFFPAAIFLPSVPTDTRGDEVSPLHNESLFLIETIKELNTTGRLHGRKINNLFKHNKMKEVLDKLKTVDYTDE